MRPKCNGRRLRPVNGIIAVLMLAIPTSAVALTAGSHAQSALQVTLNDRSITYGEPLIVTGRAPRADGGRRLLLELAAAGGRWRVVGSTSVHADGRFRFVTSPRQSGAVRVIDASDASIARDGGGVTHGSDTAFAPSAAREMAVSAALYAPVGSIAALSGQAVDLRGTLLPREAGRTMRLMARAGGRWHTLAQARTRANGHFALRYVAGQTGTERVRLSFAGDRLNGAANRTGQLTVYRQSLASWYDDGGATACGFHAGYGVANRDLPCGTKVTFRYGARRITAVVDDRGPYTGGRDWDLNQNTAGALGFDGVGTVWSSR